MLSDVRAWLDWESEQIQRRGPVARVVVRGDLGSLDRRVAEWVVADTLGVAERHVLVTLDGLSVEVSAGALDEPETYRALIDEAIAHSCLVSRRA
ncbi:MAG: hypothetical protein ITG02_12275 [Patulibacter sp.]|nr:hypothetical protein [Patulibacter sp.]